MLFPKANVDAVKGLIPGVNFIEWAKIIGRPTWWPILLLVPIVNIFIFTGMAVNMVRSFAQYKFVHSAAAVIFAPAIFAWMAKNDEVKFDGPNFIKERDYMAQMREAQKSGDKKKLERLERKSPYKKSFIREWTESIVFAVFAAAFIRMFLIEAFVIPTPSMEGSLLVGDFLFVSKASYGIRTPMTVAMIPLLHNRIPGMDAESYLKKPSLKYHRLPALESIDRNKPIVFNWPVGDSVYITNRRSYTVAQVERAKGRIDDRELNQKVKKKNFVVRPIDKRDHYIKRCLAMPGDSLQIINRQVYVNGIAAENPKNMQFGYYVKVPNNGLNKRVLEKWGIAQTHADVVMDRAGNNIFFLDSIQVDNLLSISEDVNIIPMSHKGQNSDMFPHDPKISGNWTVDDYGPIWIPKAGVTVDINNENIALYERVISVYENNEYERKNGRIYINGEEANTYTFKQDYYWAMGDNRHNSEDSRAWGFVPHDHMVGKPLFIWFSTKNANLSDGIRFDRMFKSADVE